MIMVAGPKGKNKMAQDRQSQSPTESPVKTGNQPGLLKQARQLNNQFLVKNNAGITPSLF